VKIKPFETVFGEIMWGKKTYVHFNNIDNSEHGHAQACGECVSNLKTSDELNN
jgi:hypothetical protein